MAWRLLSGGCIVLVAWLVLGAGVFFGQAADSGIGVRVSYLQGQAAQLDGDAPDVSSALEQGQRLMPPVLLRVEQGARMGLEFPDKSHLRLAGPAMALVRDAFLLEGERIIDLELSRGLAWLGIRPFSGDRDTVRLTLPASVLDTGAVQCEVRVGPDRRVMVAVFGGQATVRTAEDGELQQEEPSQAGPKEDGFLPGVDEVYESEGPLDMGSASRLLRQNEQVLLNLSGRVGEKRTMTPFEVRDSAWASWNRARDAKTSLDLLQD